MSANPVKVRERQRSANAVARTARPSRVLRFAPRGNVHVSLIPIVPILLAPLIIVVFVVLMPVWFAVLAVLGIVWAIAWPIDKIIGASGGRQDMPLTSAIRRAFRWVLTFGGLAEGFRKE
jgi:hypothetical protein